MPNYQTIDDFVADDSFQRWVLSENKEAKFFWESYLQQYPEQKGTIFQAVELVRSLQFNEVRPSTFQEKKVWGQIQEELSERKPVVSFRPYHRRPLAVAASIALVIGFAVWLGWQNWGTDLYVQSTAYGKVRELYLPDSSRVTLNGNSTIRFAKDWTTKKKREIWLEGEAFFEVKPVKDSQKNKDIKFAVYTSQLTVEVLGTTFNVSDRVEQAYVVLTEGRIALNIEDEHPITMQPGELFEIRGTSRIHKKDLPDISQWSSWKEEELEFNNLPLRDIADKLRYTYGYQLKFPSDTIANEKFTARIYRQDMEMLFSLIARSFDLNYTTQGKNIEFASRQ